MDNIMLLNIIVTLVISTLYMAAYQKRAINMVEFIFKNIDSKEENITENMHVTQTHIIAATWLIIISGITLTIGFIALYFFQSKSSSLPSYVQTFISSGLHIPLFLFVIGFVIRLSYKIYTKKSSNFSLTIFELKTIVFIMAIIINITLIILDWQLGLFVVAIILGKFIWIDFVFDAKSLITVILNTFKEKEDMGVGFLCFQYAKSFYPAFFVPTITYQSFFRSIPYLSTRLLYMIPIYIVVISMFSNAISGMDYTNASFKINFNKIKK